MSIQNTTATIDSTRGLQVVARNPAKEPYYVLAARDSVLASRLGEEIAGTHLAEYLGESFTDLSDLAPLTRAWYEAIGAYALRYCRDLWRMYARERAVARALQVVDDMAAQCFLQPSETDPAVYVRMPRKKIEAIVSVLVTEILAAHRHALDGTCEPAPLTLETLHRESRP